LACADTAYYWDDLYCNLPNNTTVFPHIKAWVLISYNPLVKQLYKAAAVDILLTSCKFSSCIVLQIKLLKSCPTLCIEVVPPGLPFDGDL